MIFRTWIVALAFGLSACVPGMMGMPGALPSDSMPSTQGGTPADCDQFEASLVAQGTDPAMAAQMRAQACPT